jgi:hypothetical protein
MGGKVTTSVTPWTEVAAHKSKRIDPITWQENAMRSLTSLETATPQDSVANVKDCLAGRVAGTRWFGRLFGPATIEDFDL